MKRAVAFLGMAIGVCVGCHPATMSGPHSPSTSGGGGGRDMTVPDSGRGASPADASSPASDAASGAGGAMTSDGGPSPDAAPGAAPDGPSPPPGPVDYGGVGQEPLIPLDH